MFFSVLSFLTTLLLTAYHHHLASATTIILPPYCENSRARDAVRRVSRPGKFFFKLLMFFLITLDVMYNHHAWQLQFQIRFHAVTMTTTYLEHLTTSTGTRKGKRPTPPAAQEMSSVSWACRFFFFFFSLFFYNIRFILKLSTVSPKTAQETLTSPGPLVCFFFLIFYHYNQILFRYSWPQDWPLRHKKA
jgi:hypothetical protein